MKTILNTLFEYQELSADQARSILHEIAGGQYNPAQIASFLTVYRMRPVTVEEMRGFRSALLDLCLHIDLSDYKAIDLCGTGGDGKNTFNISTLTSFVVAGAGYKVAKHGNYGVSSVCGSSNVMERLGYRFSNQEDQIKRELDQAGISFLHAPLFHPAMKAVGPIRFELGIKTFFNMLGPLVNPSRPAYQLTGVFDLELARLYKYILQKEGTQYTIVHALDGYDEVSLTGPFRLITPERDEIVEPDDMGFRQLKAEELFGGDTISEAAAIFTKVLSGKSTAAHNEVVLANASLAIATLNPNLSMGECREQAESSLLGGKAESAFQSLIATSQP
ncbi:UNVERIFIED_CONTAM: hypothetical protein GTU68_003537 [Idotea baltica]|nr:hypothetical protein [Idotea baltica]